MDIVVLSIYGIALLFIFLFSLIQLQLIFKYKKYKSLHLKKKQQIFEGDTVPFITIQLPIFNEKYVAERLVDAVVELEYPKEKLEIQLLDDSTDHTYDILHKKAGELKLEGFDIKHIHRKNRLGFKAGALAEGLELAKGEFVAIFDADFIPSKDFLVQTLPFFKEEKVGMVQCRWEHLNEHYSLLTKLQAFGLDAHFTIEQSGRNAANHFINFNGTAGIWRREAILDAGGWSADTLTEDLDLSYRAQLKGWKFEYVEALGAPAELPATMAALKTQQHRWNKGAAECVRKNLLNVLCSKKLSWGTKVNALFHLMNSTVFLAIAILTLLSIPVLMIKSSAEGLEFLFNGAMIFLLSLPILAFFYWISYRQNEKRKKLNFLLLFPAFLSMSMGMSLHNAKAVLEGYLGIKTPFIRTPKFNLTHFNRAKSDEINNVKKQWTWVNLLEFIFAIYSLYGIILAFQLNEFGLLPFHLFLFIGFSLVFIYSFFGQLSVKGASK
jgi:cellulose synthase/poly-beta-1,6-N-acetylglucosamine synthase-like glycosyltransferase